MQVTTTLQAYERIGVLGLGLTGLSAARFLLGHGLSPVLMDTRAESVQKLQAEPALAACEQYLGALDLEALLSLDLVIMSPGLAFKDPALLMARDAGVEFISDIELFARLVRVPVIGVTGSNGKSTVVSLVTHMLRECGRDVGLGGNIGTPALDLFSAEHDCMVLELSSFQLEQTHSLNLAAATVLNISADHMDRYPSLDAYALTKNRIYRRAEVLVFNRDDKRTLPSRVRALQHTVSFGLQDDDQNFALELQGGDEFICFNGQPLVATQRLSLPGEYNKANVMASLALVAALGVDLERAAQAATSFQALKHRCQLVKDAKHVRWINDSKATNIGAAAAAVEGLRADVTGKLILIAGGDAKGADLNELKPVLAQVDELITLGKDGPAIAALKAGSHQVSSMSQAVKKAASLASKGSLVLLSPACASLDMFNDYQQRGDVFIAAVEAVHGVT
ncbi:UDP-N-acetylmuramoyl-L-alanine--D-glutamate ligase [Aliidiomarina maris]|uniref:UDP-N-acetylmuramoylalanine--D-glutamate ligase n=1 Tax=Aliidiomarina maris TaxID=531312 RepID=A0A327WPQ8_9GAMM|nr:UDP-N-acetylmuramoyl-L-alanine--D-glutamate ligase [Aliidiomarina maris]RAJ93919.1 UDP-N-acetylmuramoylalanine--D-glutamate ligase [Aliidiomarina maris]RUO27830.1 UDP-N-acetylmuramoyl-L-alanine--D-glutamate ligase [Aliidiomarina maris]